MRPFSCGNICPEKYRCEVDSHAAQATIAPAYGNNPFSSSSNASAKPEYSMPPSDTTGNDILASSFGGGTIRAGGNTKTRKSTASLSMTMQQQQQQQQHDEGNQNGRFSLAHELAHALMPEPSAGSKLLAEEFGIEYDEGAEGIDEPPPPSVSSPISSTSVPSSRNQGSRIGGEENGDEDIPFVDGNDNVVGSAGGQFGGDGRDEIDPTFGGSHGSFDYAPRRKEKKKRDAMETLSGDLNSTERFLTHLRTVDVAGSTSATTTATGTYSTAPLSPTGSSFGSSGTLEQLASTIIQKLNSSAQDRESQVRELLSYEREFRKFGGDVLGVLDELPPLEVETVNPRTQRGVGGDPSLSPLSPSRLADVPEESMPPSPRTPRARRHHHHRKGDSMDWDSRHAQIQSGVYDDDDGSGQDEDDDDDSEDDEEGSYAGSPTKARIPAPPPLPSSSGGTISPAQALPHLTYIRTTTTSLVSSLSTLSEQAQINSVYTTEAGRKIRALRGKLGEWKEEYDEVEKSKVRVLEWERDEVKGRGRKMMEEELQAFQKALGDAGVRAKEIVAAA